MNVRDQARAIGDAVLYEGYLLYPYRASAGKNRVRWQWGVLVPPSYASAEIGEHSSARVECLLEPSDHTVLHVKLRFLQTRTQDSTWDEAVEHEIDFELPLAELPAERPFQVPGDGQRTHELSGVLTARADPLDGPFGGTRLRVDVHNTTSWPSDGVRRHALRHALLAAHLVLSVDTGHFLSMLDPPEWAKPAVETCRQERLWPVLIGDTSRSTVVLASPIILYDDPAIAPESPGDLFDGTEIDEILTLRTMTLTDEEKREARATDPRAAAIVDRVDTMPPELLERLHGAIRSVRPAGPSVTVAGVRVAEGSRVRLRPNLRGADAQDMFLIGKTATVRVVLSDVDGATHVAVTLDDDPGADLQHAHGRYRYFSPDEIEPLEVAE
ncbi:hypothetical protein AMES_3746 [Amycolatopsis mediterranei S699]|uniref:Uncharacterized protein n=3 Tax=Amycolatopsis mediterranei TaxID=33910 RepID=A0A0H3D3K6_AMYMU|nr:hypothetical protein [Amycolatopsis mediterranei]ADJ45570.1 conserved hypothetical protein [Amycolatopsis mediterranei U32]AEK42346.1 hypothetical protein RAM_19300 [Amycolatopsis mediterranei S699]AFO77282.1 hypothetical protein AMES_3746 [Amycolatopsis mediterranei S699]AGT84410.1 hypothetical protein B737_3746 [Amycolatopsis mediterranei RB]KDO05828.1 hypothetical protein DV26_36310 [Amycolatopsis mediterranei]